MSKKCRGSLPRSLRPLSVFSGAALRGRRKGERQYKGRGPGEEKRGNERKVAGQGNCESIEKRKKEEGSKPGAVSYLAFFSQTICRAGCWPEQQPRTCRQSPTSAGDRTSASAPWPRTDASSTASVLCPSLLSPRTSTLAGSGAASSTAAVRRQRTDDNAAWRSRTAIVVHRPPTVREMWRLTGRQHSTTAYSLPASTTTINK